MRWAIYFYEGDELPVQNAFLESFAVHYRALLDFFYGISNPRPDDMFAKDFFEDGRWEAVRPAETDALKLGRTQVGKEIAHLTYSRVKQEKTLWLYVQIHDDMKLVMAQFLRHVDHALLGIWARELVVLAGSAMKRSKLADGT